ncbi:RHS repeat-associated core domain-containing protein [Amycolatopsis sp. PS_44_ISF1]|uniref:RHS repeat-associated core domain-containing protein n=1 Tax=Amycolatopsis sp. PS_44_ISF1 TaxID=2974917 RepID=UPI0028DDFC8E|nr:RHS repeat-associated core domain-containing protein [Amycolatopsis sp. PS_44_ISF1]MDT8910134.1 DUF6531 domain-containing protein [Amycolatopsis sp. PS_44_ISF1]
MSGVPLLEDATGLKDAIESKNWAAVAIGAVGTALDVLTAVMDPFGAIFAAGVGWLIEHVGPLKEALNALTGDADQIAAQSQTWTNVAKELESVSGDLVNLVKNDLESWKGDAADAYRKQSDDTAALIASAQKGSEGAASGVKTAGEVVAAVRTLVRDTIADLVGHLISWALQVVFTLGIGMAWVVPQVVTAVAKTASKISQVTTRLVKALKALVPLLKKAGTLFEDAGKALKKLTGKVDGPKAPKVEKTPKDHVDGDGEIGGGGKDTWVCKTDPVDVARGNVVIDQVDLELPSPLVLERLHVSSYRAGRWFGPTWVSTVDQRLTVSGERVRCFSPDGTTQLYPLAAPEVPVSPLNGPRRPLTRHADGTYTQTDPIRGRELRFGALPGRGSAEFALLTITDAQGARVEADYDSRGVPVALRHSAGYRVEFETEGERVTAIHVADPGSEARVLVRRFGYSPEGHLTSEINASGLPQVYHYDDAGRVTGWQDRNGTWYRYVYDADGRCVRTVGDRGFYDGEFTYDTERRITVFTDSLGHPSEFHFSEAGQLVREVDQLGHVTAFEWDGDDHLRSRTDPLGRTNRFEYTAEGALSTVIRPDGSRARIATESDGTVTVTVAGQERSWQRVYPPGTAPDLTAAMAAPSFDQNAQLGSQPAPQPAAVPLPDVAPDLTGSVLERDLFGRPRVVTDRAGGRTRLDWTVEGQLAGRTGPLGRREEWRYDAEGNRVGQSSSPQRHTRFEFGPFGLPRVKVDSTGDRTAYEYDTELRTTRITEPTGRSWHYTYDAAGRLIEETDFDGRVLRFGYDAAGQLVRTVNGFGEVVTYAYDPLGNLVERASAAGTTTYAYDPVGLLTRAAGPGCVLEIERDERGRVVRESVNGRAVTYSHESRTLHRRTPSGVDSSWTFDDSGNAVSLAVAGHVVSFRYDPAGREVERTTDHGVALTQAFNAEHQLTGQIVTSPEHRVVQQRRYHYQPDGQLTVVEDAVSGPVRYQVDAAGRVTDVAAADGTEAYRYGPDGTITSEAHQPAAGPAVAGGRFRDAQRFAAPLGGICTYDRQGRLVGRQDARGTWAYDWDPLDRLSGVRTPDGATWRYHYDPLGRRVAKQRLTAGVAGPVVAEEVTFTWSGQHLVEQVHRDGQGRVLVLTWDNHPGTTRPVTQTEHLGEGVRFFSFVTDPIGTPVDLIDSSGGLAWHGTSTLWGKAKPQPPTGASTPLRFPGQYADEETGLHYNVFRYYDPATGRYLSQDPLGLAPAPDPGGYVSNPLLQADPLGLGCGGSKVEGNGDPAARPHTGPSGEATRVQSSNPTSRLPDDTGQAPARTEPEPAPAERHNPPDDSGDTPASSSDKGKGQEPVPDRTGQPDGGGHSKPEPNGAGSLGKFDKSRCDFDGEGRIVKIDGVPVEKKLREISRERAEQYQTMKNNKDGVSGGNTGNCVAHVIDRKTGEVFETTNGPGDNVITDVNPKLQERVDSLYNDGPYPKFDKQGNPIGDDRPNATPHPDTPLRHAEVKGVNALLNKRPDANFSDMMADPSFLRATGVKEAPYCANCDGILHDVPSVSGRRHYDPATGRIIDESGIGNA